MPNHQMAELREKWQVSEKMCENLLTDLRETPQPVGYIICSPELSKAGELKPIVPEQPHMKIQSNHAVLKQDA